jgi:hypothetical protein
MKNSCDELSYSTRRTFGLQQTWQSSTKLCLRPADSSTEVAFHSPQAAHWKPDSKVEKAYRNG